MKNEISGNLLEQIKNELRNEFEMFKKKQDEKIEKLESTIAVLQQHVSVLKAQVNENTKESGRQASCYDELEQYGRRLCLRVHGLPISEDETSSDVLQNLTNQFEEKGINIPDYNIDRAHRIGNPTIDKEGIKQHSVIIRFTTFRHRTQVYMARKKFTNIAIRLDLTAPRRTLLKNALERVKDDSRVKYAYADVNCRLRVVMENGKRHFFNSMDELNNLLS